MGLPSSRAPRGPAERARLEQSARVAPLRCPLCSTLRTQVRHRAESENLRNRRHRGQFVESLPVAPTDARLSIGVVCPASE
jgi:hypothetical protein